MEAGASLSNHKTDVTHTEGLGSPYPKLAPKPQTPGGSAKKIGYVHPQHMSSPSPSHKFPGGGTRNELFLRSVLSSPYHHDYQSYTPMSATPSGISPRHVFKTPIRADHRSPVNSKTPQDARPPTGLTGSSSLRKKKIVNPFDAALLDQLDKPVFMSPGVFTVQSTPSTDEKKPFRWSIEHIAELHPADIDEMPLHQQITPDKDVEERAQRAIDNFFSNNLIAPSPWNSSKPATSKGIMETPLRSFEPELQGSIQKQLPAKKVAMETQDACCQTALSIPIDFDINKVLGEFLTTEAKEEVGQDPLSTSSLRRKLFFHPDNSSFNISPVKGGFMQDDGVLPDACASPQVICANQVEMPFQHATPLKPPSRSHFSSSPIKNVKGLRTPEFLHTPPNREFFNSPALSPIVQGHLAAKRSSGLFSPQEKIFSDHTVQKNMNTEFARSLSSPELSPIRSDTCKTPVTKSRSKLSIQSPGVSPICPAPPVLDDDQGSFIQDSHPDLTSSDESDVDINTPLADDKQTHEIVRPPTTRKISHLTRHRQRNILHDFEDAVMDFEPNVQPSKHLRFADDIKTSSLLQPRDYSMVDTEMDDHFVAPNSTNQDTGYQTASLQSTNHDTGLTASQTNPFSVSATNEMPVSSNLTSLFSKLPIDSVLQEPDNTADSPEIKHTDDGVFDLDSIVSMEQPLIEQILYVTNPEKFGHAPYNEEEILERARRVLDMANRLYPDIQSATQEDAMTSQIMNKTGLSILHELEPIVSSTPHKGVKSSYSSTVAASEQALAILRRAGEDLAKFGHMLSSIKTSVQNSGIKQA